MSPELKRYRAAVSKARREIGKLANGETTDRHECIDALPAFRAIDRAEDKAFNAADGEARERLYAECSELRALARTAEQAGRDKRRAERDRQIAELQNKGRQLSPYEQAYQREVRAYLDTRRF